MPDIRSKLLFVAVSAFVKIYCYLLQRTSTFHISDNFTAVLKSSEPIIIATFHQDILTTYPFLLKFAQTRRLCSIASLSKDGELAAYLMELMGIKTVRGSSSREGFRGFLRLVRMVREGGYSVIFPCDGPRRPFGHVQPGVVMLSSITGIPIYILRTRAKNQVVLEKTSPKLLLPRPFSDITALEVGPIQVRKRCTKEVVKEYQAELQRTFKKLIRQADTFFKP